VQYLAIIGGSPNSDKGCAGRSGGILDDLGENPKKDHQLAPETHIQLSVEWSWEKT
jgi:hypothetical protein